jgi:ribonuclease HI
VSHPKVVVHVDGGARGNPGPAAAAAVATAPDGTRLGEKAAYIGEATNNVAEYRAIQLGIELARELGASEVELVNDSQLVARQIGGEYKVKNKGLIPLFTETMAALREFDRWSVRDVRREQNERADRLVNEELDRQAGGGGTAPTDGDGEPEEAEIEELVRRWAQAEAEREMAFLERLLAPEFTLTSGGVRTREQYLAETAESGSPGAPADPDELTVQHYGRFAVARWGHGGAAFVTDVFVKQGGRWRAVTRHITR